MYRGYDHTVTCICTCSLFQPLAKVPKLQPGSSSVVLSHRKVKPKHQPVSRPVMMSNSTTIIDKKIMIPSHSTMNISFWSSQACKSVTCM